MPCKYTSATLHRSLMLPFVTMLVPRNTMNGKPLLAAPQPLIPAPLPLEILHQFMKCSKMVALLVARMMPAGVSTSWSTSLEKALVVHVTLEFIAVRAARIMRCSQERYLSNLAILISLWWVQNTRLKCFHRSILQYLFKHIVSPIPRLPSLSTLIVAHVKVISL